MIIDIREELGWRERFPINENGEVHGKYLSWHENGNKWEEIGYLNGKLHRKLLSWYNNGNRGGKIDGMIGRFNRKYTIWDSNGKSIPKSGKTTSFFPKDRPVDIVHS